MTGALFPLAAFGFGLGFYSCVGDPGQAVVAGLFFILAAPAVALSAGCFAEKKAAMCLLAVALGLLPGWWSAVRVQAARTKEFFGIEQSELHALAGRVAGDSFRSKSEAMLFFLEAETCSDRRGNRAGALARVLVSMAGTGRVFDQERVQIGLTAGLKRLEAGLYFARADRKQFQRHESGPVDAARRAAVEALLGRCQELGRCGGLAAALLLGFSDGCDLDLVDEFVRSGTVHLLALSGMHLNLILSLLAFLARPVPGRRLRTFLFIAGTAAYVVLVGPKPSIVRAFLMFLFGALADLSGRTIPSIQPLALAFVGYGLVEPDALESVSGQLSFLAVAGILLLTRSVQRRLSPWLPGPLLPALSVSLAAQAAVTPLLFARMGGIAPIGILAGLILSPLTDLMILGSLVYIVLSTMGIPAGTVALLLNLVYDAVDSVVGAAAGFPMVKIGG